MSDQNEKKAPLPLSMPAKEPEMIGRAPSPQPTAPPSFVGAERAAPPPSPSPSDDEDAVVAAVVAAMHAEIAAVADELFSSAGALSSAVDDLDTLVSSLP